MLKKDFIQRYVDELTKMIAKVMQLKQNNEPEKANETIDEFGSDYLKISLNDLLKSDKSTIIDKLISQQDFELTHFKILEELLYQKHLLNVNHIKLKELTLVILRYVVKVDKDFSIERNNRIKTLS
ncbi:MAG: hypothetical protein P1U41_07245 [Vicingaceae bacterium]|nr:hypothetical protein [Vicingaceae bacterium]